MGRRLSDAGTGVGGGRLREGARPPAWLLGAGCAVVLALGAMGCGRSVSEVAPAAETPPRRQAVGEMPKAPEWSLTSTAFLYGEAIPPKHTCDGVDVSPELSWSAPPEGTVELVLICDDPDAPGATWSHWVLYGLSPERRSLPEGVPKSETLPDLEGAKQGRNDFGNTGYGGPCPPPGPDHHYHFRLHALNATTALAPGATQAELEKAMDGHVVGRAELMGLYAR